MAEKIKYFCNGQFKESKTDVWYDLFNPSTGEITGYAPCCTNDEVLAENNYEGYVLVEAEQDPAIANPFEYALKARKYIAEKAGL